MKQSSINLVASIALFLGVATAHAEAPAVGGDTTQPAPQQLLLAQADGGSESAAAPQEKKRTIKFERYNYDSSKIAPDAVVHIDNPWGNIHLRNHRDGHVRIEASIQRIGDNAPSPEFKPELSDDKFTFEVKVEGGEREPRNNRVDIVVYTPDNSVVNVKTYDGEIEAKKTINNLTASSHSGKIVITNHGPVDASSEEGLVQVQPMFSGWGEMKVKSGKAGAIAFLPDDENLMVEVVGATEITSEFTLDGDLPGKLKLDRGEENDDNRVLIQVAGPVKIFKTVKPKREPRGSMYQNRWQRDQSGLKH